MKRTLDALAERYAELALSKTETIGIAHADNEEGKAYLVQRLRDKGLTGKCLSVCYEPVTGSPMSARGQWRCSSSGRTEWDNQTVKKLCFEVR